LNKQHVLPRSQSLNSYPRFSFWFPSGWWLLLQKNVSRWNEKGEC
jgi:hypothetical protein